MSTFKKPIETVSREEAELYSRPFQPSSRIQALINRTSKSIGASCNVFKLEDTMRSIADSRQWSVMVQAYQGAPSIDFSALRPKGSLLKSGGTSSGAVAFMKGFDADLSVVRREEKKNSSGIGYLSWNHSELDDFLKFRSEVMYKAVYVPQPGTSEAADFLSNDALVNSLVHAYDYFKCFLVKRPPEGMLTNLCTEVVIPHKGFCVLGAVNLASFTKLTINSLSAVFKDSVRKMLWYSTLADIAADNSEVLACEDERNIQFGLGVFGLASILGDFGISYRELADHFENVFKVAGEGANIGKLTEAAYDISEPTLVSTFVYQLLRAYNEATIWLRETDIRAAFCIQPTVSTAHRSFDHYGYHTSPEIQPVRGLHTEESTRTILKSQIKGDRVIDYAPHTWTLDEVPYEDYRVVSEYFQRIMNATGLAHRHSHCWYGEKFTKEDFLTWFNSDIQNLYYRLPWEINNDAVNKSKLWQTVDDGELTGEDVDLEALFGARPLTPPIKGKSADVIIFDDPVSCGLQKFDGEANCECQM